jgi:hypothetical protein
MRGQGLPLAERLEIAEEVRRADRRRHRSTTIRYFVSLAVGVVLFFGWLVLYGLDAWRDDELSIRSDDEVLEDTLADLELVAAELDGLSLPAGGSTDAAAVESCHFVDGSLVQPTVHKTWSVSGGGDAVVELQMALAEILVDAGWIEPASPDESWSFYRPFRSGLALGELVTDTEDHQVIFEAQVTRSSTRPRRTLGPSEVFTALPEPCSVG